MTASFSIAQTKTDFQGTWNGTDNAGNANAYELILNANGTCSFKVNGAEIYGITNYRIISIPSTVVDDEILTPVREILFQTNIHNTVDNKGGTFTGTGNSQFLIYKGELKLTDDTFTHLEVTFKTAESADPLQFSLSR